MFKFFNQSYNTMRKDKINVYQVCKIYQTNLNETNSARWPINYYPNFHSFSEFGLQLLGIFLKPFICIGLASWSFYQAFVNGLATICYAIFFDFDQSYMHLKNTFYFASEMFYLLASMILDPILNAISFVVRSLSTIGLGLTKLTEEKNNHKEGEPSPTETNSPKEGDTNGTESSYVNLGNSKIERNTSSLTSNGFSDLMVNEDEWNNAPVF
jgi:hypothetical protein